MQKLLFPDAMVPKNILQYSFRIDHVFAENLVDGLDGTAEVFGDKVGRGAAFERMAGVGEGSSRAAERFVVADVGDKSRICIGNQVGFHRREGRAELIKSQSSLSRQS